MSDTYRPTPTEPRFCHQCVHEGHRANTNICFARPLGTNYATGQTDHALTNPHNRDGLCELWEEKPIRELTPEPEPPPKKGSAAAGLAITFAAAILAALGWVVW